MVTPEEAKRWLAKIGGHWAEAKDQTPGMARIVVTIERALGGSVSRHAAFDDRLTGYLRELAIREALANACTELRGAIA
ncbi:MAG TPA: hypothetical protein VF765_29945 [Polyangiaceae bacterium]